MCQTVIVNLLIEPSSRFSGGVLQGGGACIGPRSRLPFRVNVNAENALSQAPMFKRREVRRSWKG